MGEKIPTQTGPQVDLKPLDWRAYLPTHEDRHVISDFYKADKHNPEDEIESKAKEGATQLDELALLAVQDSSHPDFVKMAEETLTKIQEHNSKWHEYGWGVREQSMDEFNAVSPLSELVNWGEAHNLITQKEAENLRDYLHLAPITSESLEREEVETKRE